VASVRGELFLVPVGVKKGDLTQLTKGSGAPIGGGISPDGKLIASFSESRERPRGNFVIPADGFSTAAARHRYSTR